MSKGKDTKKEVKKKPVSTTIQATPGSNLTQQLTKKKKEYK
ncbi:hypothetical protein [Paenibacillus agricola]|nr:hypothetical protein [Paenibacillus agricola]